MDPWHRYVALVFPGVTIPETRLPPCNTLFLAAEVPVSTDWNGQVTLFVPSNEFLLFAFPSRDRQLKEAFECEPETWTKNKGS